MGDVPIANLGRIIDTDPSWWDQRMSIASGYGSWPANPAYLAGTAIANFRGPNFISINAPVSMELNQSLFIEYQQQWTATVSSLTENVQSLMAEIAEMKSEILRLQGTRTFAVPLSTLEPEPLEMTKPIFVTVHGEGDNFTATFIEANISASGETAADAIANFKESLASRFEILQSKSLKELGVVPARQLRILKSVVKPIERADAVAQ